MFGTPYTHLDMKTTVTILLDYRPLFYYYDL